jgi:hypothetical protein
MARMLIAAVIGLLPLTAIFSHGHLAARFRGGLG